MDLEAELFFGPFDGVEEEDLHGMAVEDHLLSVCPGGDVIDGAGLQFSISAHTAYMGQSRKML
jgi:hypothetical protein